MPRLIHLNGPPGIGKTTLARRYVRDHALAFCLDIDGVRCLIGQWDTNEQESGRLARLMAVEMARTHLSEGHDVVVPQYVARPEFVQLLATTAVDCGTSFHEVVLWADEEAAEGRFNNRSSDPELAGHHRDATAMIGTVGGFREMYGQLQRVLTQLPSVVVLRTLSGDVEATYRGLLSVLDALVA